MRHSLDAFWFQVPYLKKNAALLRVSANRLAHGEIRLRIKYQSRFGIATKELRDITGGHEFASWNNGDEREIAEDATLMAREPTGKIVRKNAVRTLLEFGPDFVDADTGKNPLYVCSRSGEDALEMHFTDRATMQVVWLTDDGTETGKRLCLAEWLADHPEYIEQRNKYDWPLETVAKAQEIRAAHNGNGDSETQKPKKSREKSFPSHASPEGASSNTIAEGAQ